MLGMPMPERLEPPPMSDPPTQVELGHYVYYLACMACHGDQGQGLTEEWREVWGPPHQNCWQSKCHAANHPPEGFELPRYAPPVIGAETLPGLQTAADLYEYLRGRMPWQAPGTLQDEEYWQLTAFLANANGVFLDETPLGPDNAAKVRMRPQPVETPSPTVSAQRRTVWPLLLTIGALLGLGTLILRGRFFT
jgi:cytochrome c